MSLRLSLEVVLIKIIKIIKISIITLKLLSSSFVGVK